MAETDIKQAIGRIQSEKLKERTEGFEDLKHIFAQNKKDPRIDALTDKGYYKIFEAVFHGTQLEKSSYIKATSASSKSHSATRLSLYASVLRTLVETGVRQLRQKSVKAIVDHIIQTTLVAGKELCEPLCLDHTKALKAIVEFQPHVEHFPTDVWQQLVDFCSNGICLSQEFSSERNLSLPVRQLSSTISNSFSVGQSMGHGRLSAPSSRAVTDVSSKATIEELLLCLEHLVSASNAPILERVDNILASVLQFLTESSAIGRSHLAALTVINLTLAKSASNSISLTQKTIMHTLPLLRRWWTTKSVPFKDQMLVTLINNQVYLEAMILQPESGVLRADLEGLLDVMQIDYSKRLDREQLQLEDIGLLSPKRLSTPGALRASTMYLRGRTVRIEQSWMIPQIMAVLISILGLNASKHVDLKDGHNSDGPNKRRRVATYVESLVRQIEAPSVSSKLSALHTLLFVVDGHGLQGSQTKMVMAQLITLLSDENSLVASWAMMTLACCAARALPNDLATPSQWLHIWQLTSRSATAAATSRAACHLMETILVYNLVNINSIGESVDRMISLIDVEAPAMLVDSALSFWALMLVKRNTAFPTTLSIASERVLHWFLSRWNPAKLTDRYYVAQQSFHVQHLLILNLLSACAGRVRIDAHSEPSFGSGILAQAWLRHLQTRELTRYLLLLDETEQLPYKEPSQDTLDIDVEFHSEGRYPLLELQIIEFCAVEFEQAVENWTNQSSEKSQHVNYDMIRTLVSLCIIGAIIPMQFSSQDVQRTTRLSKSTEALFGALTIFMLRQDCEQGHVDTVLETLSPILPNMYKIRMRHAGANLNTFLELIAEALQTRRDVMDDSSGRYRPDPMEVDDDFDSQRSRGRMQLVEMDFPRNDLAASVNVATFRCSVSGQLQLLYHSAQALRRFSDQMPPRFSFLDYLFSLKHHELLASRGFLRDLVSQALLNRHDADALLVHLGEIFLEDYEYNRCEVALGTCLDVMTGCCETWAQEILDELSDTAASLYRWFITKALEKGILSANAQIGIANLLHRLLQVQPEYPERFSLPTVRMSLLKVLDTGEILVKFHMAEQISGVFGLFGKEDHDAIFEEVLSTLPRDADWMAGIAIRLLVLAKLASAWYTILRRGVYHIFETPGLILEATEHAKRCLSMVSRALDLDGPCNLLTLFLPQILYTWLETQPLHSMPFFVFGYSNLADLLRDVRQEAMGQLVMRGNDDQVKLLADTLGVSMDDLILESFGKIAAYSIARDISLPPVASPTKYIGGEVRIRKRIGKENFLMSVHCNFAQILALFFKCVEEEQQIDRAFAKHPSFAYAAEILKAIKTFASSDYALPANQQPSFRARYLLDEIEHLCRRSGHDATRIWNPALFTFILRELLDSIRPALGPLHACSVVRTIRILVCIGGDVALQDYPLEMLLHSLRPFLIDPQSADDTIGLLRYLLELGKAHLEQIPSFVTGISFSILASLQALLNVSWDRTTQNKQHQSTQANARAFHAWFGSFLERYRPPSITGRQETAIKKILQGARHIHGHGSAVRGTAESDTLRELLEDERSGRKLLSRPSRNLAFSLLCAEFQRPSSYRDDILGGDDSACLNATMVWSSCQWSDVGKDYLLWAGRVLGRTYAASGTVPKELLTESDFVHLKDLARGSCAYTSGSKPAVLRLLQDLLLSNEQAEVSLAGLTLQRIVLRLTELNQTPEFEQVLPVSLSSAFNWQDIRPPEVGLPMPQRVSVGYAVGMASKLPLELWIRDVCIAMAYAAEDEALVGALPPVLSKVSGFAEHVFPFILHIILLREIDRRQDLRHELSDAFKRWFQDCDESSAAHVKLILTAILYLRSQPIPRETTKADRERWLDLDHEQLAKTATKCRMFKTGLLWVEIHVSEAGRSSRRSSAAKVPDPTELLLEIFKNIEEPDSFYGVQQQASLQSIMDRLDYEKDGFKSLSFRGADYDTDIRHAHHQDELDPTGLIRALNHLALSGLSLSMLESRRTQKPMIEDTGNMYRSARRLEQWDLPTSTISKSEEATVYRTFQCLNNISDPHTLTNKLDAEILQLMTAMAKGKYLDCSAQSMMRTLAVLNEVDEVMTSRNSAQLSDAWGRLHSRQSWMVVGRFEDVSQIQSARETLFSTLSRQSHLQHMLGSNVREIQEIEVAAVLETSRMSRSHGALQSALTAAMYLSKITASCKAAGIEIEAVAHLEAANVLWDLGEMAASTKILHSIRNGYNLSKQTLRVGTAELLAKLSHQVSEARLQRSDEIISQYLLPAIKELKGLSEGNEAGQVFHEFASFCDRQLQDVDNLEDFQRVERLRQRKEKEVHDLENMLNSAGAQNKSNLQAHKTRAKQWFDLDDREYQRLRESRQAFLTQSLENYLLCLKACENFDTDVLRFCALWLEHSESETANAAVSKHLPMVPSRKFVTLMNQLSSRLLNVEGKFQRILFPLIQRICTDHPYHGMYQIFSTSKSKGKDELALSRHAAASKMAALLRKDPSASEKWLALYNTNVCYARLALEKLDERYKPGSKIPLRKLHAGQRLEQDVPACRTPPPTMKIEVRPDCNYSSIPIVSRIQPDMTVAGGVSAPKIITAIGSDGVKYKQLVKGGNDDLRQDAIMEQVFEHVSALLQHDRSTRQRNLAIRTYKVMPLTTNAGIIEFVPNTIPLHDFLMPSHQKHYPKDWKPQACRKAISDVQSKSVEARLKAYHQVAEHFRPVLRYFFMERFDNPDDWFEKRLAYSRSTAAISILGHVLGLGDRHGHNILLDEKTGEVAHIDLGVAFEQGRVLPVPEVVPFRLTRDIVDAMGITKTEGVFRRCCEFTLDALRKESYSIMTVLDVLRYDPLYNWTVSPLRMKKIQEQSNDVPQPSLGDPGIGTSNMSKGANEPSEADRALTVVAKKLSKTLSVMATVNELIQQATDERNLAVLYCGWAAYA